jgi:hypothetical protein
MPVTIIPSNHEPRPWKTPFPAKSPAQLLDRSLEHEVQGEAEVLISSFDELKETDGIDPSSGSFVRGAIEAWARHLHLVLRPEDIWFTILGQMNFYMTENAESLRHIFVGHEGRERISIFGHELYSILGRFGVAIQKCVKTPWLHDWIMPDFSTTVEKDKMTATMFMMGLMQHYFIYGMGIICGLPSVTLLGEREDWVKLLSKLDRLHEFGDEPTIFAERLKPVLSSFIQSFDTPTSCDTRDFWNKIVHAKSETACGLPPFSISGWLMAFCFWDEKGRRYRGEGIGIDNIPVCYATVPVTIYSFKGMEQYPATVVAGGLAKRVTSAKEYGNIILKCSQDASMPSHQTTNADPGNGKTAKRRSFLSALNCFRGMQDDREEAKSPSTMIKTPTSSTTIFSSSLQLPPSNLPIEDQGMLQPLSGWMLFGPSEKKVMKTREYSRIPEFHEEMDTISSYIRMNIGRRGSTNYEN